MRLTGYNMDVVHFARKSVVDRIESTLYDLEHEFKTNNSSYGTVPDVTNTLPPNGRALESIPQEQIDRANREFAERQEANEAYERAKRGTK